MQLKSGKHKAEAKEKITTNEMEIEIECELVMRGEMRQGLNESGDTEWA